MPETIHRLTVIRPYAARIRSLRRTAAFPQVDLRPRIRELELNIRSQGSRGTCSIFATTFLLEYMYATRMHGVPHDLSEEYLNFVTDTVSGERRDGDFFHNIDLGYQEWGIVPETVVPYATAPVQIVPQSVLDRGRNWTRFKADFLKPWDASRGVTQGQLERAVACLDQDIPIACGSWWPTAGNWTTTTVKGVEVMTVPPVGQKNITLADGHSVALVGYRTDADFPGGGYFVFRNSWLNNDGTPWGDEGYGYMPFEYLRRFTNDLMIYTTRALSGGRLGAQSVISQREKIDVATTETSGTVLAATWEQSVQNGRWRGWWSILNGRIRADSEPTLVARDASRLDIFGIGTDGMIYTAAWDTSLADGQWRGWWRILNTEAANHGNICAVSRDVNKLDVFTIGTKGEIKTAAWDQHVDNAKWRGWWRIANGIARAENGVTAVARSDNKLDVFIVGTDGGIYTAAWDQHVDDAKWRGWWRIGTGIAGAHSNVSVVCRDPNKLDVFIVGTDGGIYTAAWDQRVDHAKWRGWWRVTTGVAAAKSKVCSVSRTADKLDVFMVGTDGGVYTAAWDQHVDHAKWRGWWRIGDLEANAAGGVAAISRDANSLDVIATGRDGCVYTAAWNQHVDNGNWRGWWRIGP